MAHRERIAWLTLATMLIAYGVYFTLIGMAVRRGEPRLVDILWTFGAVAVLHGLAVLLGSMLLAWRSSGEARLPADERDRAIARRGASVGYYVLLAGMILVGVVMPFGDRPGASSMPRSPRSCSPKRCAMRSCC